MKIAIDASNLSPANQTRGIGIYTNQLFKGLLALDTHHEIILARSKKELKGAHLIHFPNLNFFFRTLPLIKRCPWVITVHDVIPLVFPQHFPPGIRGKIKQFIQIHLLKKAEAIITDSQNSSCDIVKHLQISEKKIHVIHLASSNHYKLIKSQKLLKSTQEKYQLNKPFILYVGDVNYNKNIPNLIRAFSKIKANVDLVLVSRAWKSTHIPEVKSINQLIKRLNIAPKVKQISNLSVDSHIDLVHLYNLAKIYVQPSLYEGFGLPALEAMACGTVVVSSNTSSLPEVCGQAAILAKPTPTDLSVAIKKALSLSSDQKQAMIQKGIKQASKFSWQKTATQTLSIYNQVINQK